MSAKFDILLVSMNNNIVRAILATDLSSTDSWAAMEEYSKELDCSQSLVIDDITGKNEVGKPYRGLLPSGAVGFEETE